MARQVQSLTRLLWTLCGFRMSTELKSTIYSAEVLPHSVRALVMKGTFLLCFKGTNQ